MATTSNDKLSTARAAYDRNKAQYDADRAELNQTLSEHIKSGEPFKGAEQLAELDRRAAELKTEKARLDREERLREDAKRRFLAGGIGTAEDFAELWDSRLREEALLYHANMQSAALRQPYFQEF